MKNMKLFLLACLCLALFLPAAVQAKTITLSLTDQNSDVGWGPVHATQPWAKQVEKATNGRVKIQIYPSQTLAKGKESWNATKHGIADMSWNVMTFFPGLTPYADVITLPGLPVKSGGQNSEVLWKLFEKYPAVSDQFAENKVLLLHTSDPFSLLTRKKQVKTLEDIKGLNIRSVGGPMVESLKALGCNPMMIPMPDCYIAMQKGTVDGMAAPWEAVHGFRLHEVTKYITSNVPLGGSYFAVVMNKKKWNSLSKDLQDAIMSVSGLKGSIFFGQNFFDLAAKEVPKLAKEQGHDIGVYSLPAKERARWDELAAGPVWENWIKKMEGNGYKEARKILNATLEMLK